MNAPSVPFYWLHKTFLLIFGNKNNRLLFIQFESNFWIVPFLHEAPDLLIDRFFLHFSHMTVMVLQRQYY